MERTGTGDRDWPPLILLVILAAIVRTWLAWHNPLITTDGPFFVWNAQEWVEQGWRQAVLFQKHPLYPALIALCHAIVGSYERAGQVISIVCGSLTVIPIFLLGRRLAGRSAGFLAATLLIPHWYIARYSGDVMTEATYFLWLTLATWLGHIAGAERKAWAASLAGIAAGLAYLTRVEGAISAAIVGVWILLAGAQTWRTDWHRRLLQAVALSVAFWITISPYLWALHEVTGRWVLTKKGGAVAVESYAPKGSKAVVAKASTRVRVGEVMRHMWGKGWNAFKWYAAPFACAFLFGSFAKKDRGTHRFLAFAWFTWLAFFCVAEYHLGYISHRHLLTLVVLALPWMGAGGVGFWAWSRSQEPEWVDVVAGCLAVGFFLTVAIVTLRPRRDDQTGFKEAGEWIRAQRIPEGTQVLCINEKVAYYAGARLLMWPKADIDSIDGLLHPPVLYAAATEKEIRDQTPGFLLKGRADRYERVWQSEPYGKMGPVVVYRIKD